MSSNPYAAPKAAVADAASAPQGTFVPGGRGTAAGRGWDWIVAGWDLFVRQPGMWILIFLALMVASVVLSFIPLVGIAVNILGPVVGGGLMIGCRALDSGQELEFGHVFAGFRDKFGPLAAVGAIALVVSFVIVVLVVLTIGGGIMAMAQTQDPNLMPKVFLTGLLAFLVILALMLPVVMAMWFAPALIVFHGRGPIDAMKESFSGCLRNVVPYLVYSIILLVPALLGTVLIGLGWLVLGPVVAASIYASYRDIYFTS